MKFQLIVTILACIVVSANARAINNQELSEAQIKGWWDDLVKPLIDPIVGNPVLAGQVVSILGGLLGKREINEMTPAQIKGWWDDLVKPLIDPIVGNPVLAGQVVSILGGLLGKREINEMTPAEIKGWWDVLVNSIIKPTVSPIFDKLPIDLLVMS
jgi:homoserine acetyltransferase